MLLVLIVALAAVAIISFFGEGGASNRTVWVLVGVFLLLGLFLVIGAQVR
jgi:hypothetical protein